MPIVIKLSKSDSSVPWGFRLHGGKDFGAPLTVQRINPGSISAKCGLEIGDVISAIDSVATNGLKHKEAQDLIVKGGNDLKLTIYRGTEIPTRSGDSSELFSPVTLEKNTFGPADSDLPVSSYVENLTIRDHNKSALSSYSSGAVPYKAPPPSTISSKNASLYHPSLQAITSGLTRSTNNSNHDAEEFPPPPPLPPATSPIQVSFPVSDVRPHQPERKFPEMTVTEESSSIAKSSGTGGYVPSETYKLVKNIESGLDVPFNPRTGAGVRSSPIQSKLVDILEKKHATIENERIQETISKRPVSPQPHPIHSGHREVNHGGAVGGIPGRGVPPSRSEDIKISAPAGFRGMSSSLQPCSKTSVVDGLDPDAIPICNSCKMPVRGAYVMAINKVWCPDHFICSQPDCKRNLSETGFVEEQGEVYCKEDYEKYFAPKCAKCHRGILGNTVKALKSTYHPECFTCVQCNQAIMGGSFHLHEGQVYCDRDFKVMFSAKCQGCNFPIEVGDDWIEAVGTNWHGDCFNCAVCQVNLQNTGFVHRNGRFLCKDHAK